MNRLVFLSALTLTLSLSTFAHAETITCGVQDGLESDINKGSFFNGFDETFSAGSVVASSKPGATAENVSPLGRWIKASIGARGAKLVCTHDYKSGSASGQIFLNWPVQNLSCKPSSDGRTLCATSDGKSLAVSCKEGVRIRPTLGAPADFKSDSGKRPVVSYIAKHKAPKVSSSNVLTCEYQVSTDRVEYTRLMPAGKRCKAQNVAPPAESGFDCQAEEAAPVSTVD